MSTPHIFLFTVLAMGFGSLVETVSNPNPRVRQSGRMEASYLISEVANLSIDTEQGQVFFDAGKERYVWEVRTDNLGDKLQAAFALIDHLPRAARIDVSRWPPPGNDRPDRAQYRNGVLYYWIDGLNLVYLPTEKK